MTFNSRKDGDLIDELRKTYDVELAKETSLLNEITKLAVLLPNPLELRDLVSKTSNLISSFRT